MPSGNPKDTIYYDIESTGLSKQFDVPAQFAAIKVDASGSQTGVINIKGRIPRTVLPSPKALTVTGQLYSEMQSRPLSHYELMREISEFFEDNQPAVIASYNGLSYDEEVLRHSFYANLRQPYVTQFGGNKRLDILELSRATAVAAPAAINLLINDKGKRSFKLVDVASANGFADHDAHDALGDVRATMFVASHIAKQAPDVWRAGGMWQSKERMLELLESEQPIAHLSWNHSGDKPTARVLVPVSCDTTNSNEWICVDPTADIVELMSLSVAQLAKRFRSRKGITAIRCVKANSMPLIAPLNAKVVSGVGLPWDEATANTLINALDFHERLREAAELRKSEYPEPDHVKKALYSGGFFPANNDKNLFAAFHDASPPEKAAMITDFNDPRATELAWLLVGAEWPEALSKGDREAFEDELRESLMLEKADWTTVPSALREICELMDTATPSEKAILEDYRSHLLDFGQGSMSIAAE